MKERPILFSGAMVRALLDGSKTQTRRVCKPMNSWVDQTCREVRSVEGVPCHFLLEAAEPIEHLRSPYGTTGDRLYVRETWSPDFAAHYPFERAWYAADDDRRHEIDVRDGVRGIYSPESCEHVPFRWRPSIHMPRWASRITLEVTDVRVERLQAMEGQTAFESDALKEGIKRIHHGDGEYGYHVSRTEPHPNNWTDPCDAFRDLWDSLNAARGHGWVTNPWVWVVEFKRIDA